MILGGEQAGIVMPHGGTGSLRALGGPAGTSCLYFWATFDIGWAGSGLDFCLAGGPPEREQGS